MNLLPRDRGKQTIPSFILMANPYLTAFAREESKGFKDRRGLCRGRRKEAQHIERTGLNPQRWQQGAVWPGLESLQTETSTRPPAFMWLQYHSAETFNDNLHVSLTARAARSLWGPSAGDCPVRKPGLLPTLKVRLPSGSATCSPCPKIALSWAPREPQQASLTGSFWLGCRQARQV